jgi:hypothetical protein
MLRWVPGTLAIFATHLVLSAAFCGIGLTLRRAFRLRSVSVDDVLLAFWMGLGATLVFLLAWNFALPVNGAALALVLVTGLTGLVAAWRRAAREPAGDPWRPPMWALVAIGILGLWFANAALHYMDAWDTAMYQMQAVRWAREYPAVPGLANLFGPLGYNSTNILYDAMVDHGFWSGRAWHVVNGPPLLAAAAAAVFGAARFAQKGSAADLFPVLLLAPVVNLVIVGSSAASFRTDMIVTLVILTIVTRWHALLVRDPGDDREAAWTMLCLALLAGVAVTLKLTAFAFATLCAGVMAAAAIAGPPERRAALARALGLAFAIVAAVGIAWMARSVVLSGYPLFPSRALVRAVDWRVPAMHAQAEYDYVVAAGRGVTGAPDVVSGRLSGFGAWVPLWLTHVRRGSWFDVIIPAALAAAALLLLVVMWLRADPAARVRSRAPWMLAVPLAGALAAWFLIAPEPRFGAPLWWSLAALITGQAFVLARGAGRPAVSRGVLACACVLGLSPAIVAPLQGRRGDANPLLAIARWNTVIPPDGAWFGGSASPQLTTFTTTSGLELRVPEQRCWDTALPCTATPAPNLRLRTPGQLARGFAVDGPWQMQDWPAKSRPDFLPAWRESLQRRGLHLEP